MGFKSVESGVQFISRWYRNPIDVRHALVNFAECDGFFAGALLSDHSSQSLSTRFLVAIRISGSPASLKFVFMQTVIIKYF